MIRFFGWDRSGVPVRNRADFQRRNKIGAFLATEESLAYRTGRSVVYGEIVTLALGIIAKAKIDRLELNRLLTWAAENMVNPDEWPAGAIMKRLDGIYTSQGASEEDVEDLILLLEDIAGDSSAPPAGPVEIPFVESIPSLEFKGKEFVFAGRFVYGRPACLEIVQLLGGTHADRVSNNTDFLVIGPLHSSHWQSGPIRVAVDAATQTSERIALGRLPTAIISEQFGCRRYRITGRSKVG